MRDIPAEDILYFLDGCQRDAWDAGRGSMRTQSLQRLRAKMLTTTEETFQQALAAAEAVISCQDRPRPAEKTSQDQQTQLRRIVYPVSDRFFLRESDVRQALGTI